MRGVILIPPTPANINTCLVIIGDTVTVEIAICCLGQHISGEKCAAVLLCRVCD